MRSLVTATLLSLVIGAGAALAQTPAPKPAAKPADPAKAAISKECSTQADAKGLHGKERKKFRSECKLKGGKTG
jgi:psiF repeat-containing protein